MGGPGTGQLVKVGSGSQPKETADVWLGGHAGKKATKARPVLPPVDRFPAPEGMPEDQLVVWSNLAPHAFDARTLTRGTAAAFRDLCEAVVVKDTLFQRILADGYTVETKMGMVKHPLLTDYRGMFQRVEMGLLKFKLAPLGKPMVEAVEPDADPFQEFDSQ